MGYNAERFERIQKDILKIIDALHKDAVTIDDALAKLRSDENFKTTEYDVKKYFIRYRKCTEKSKQIKKELEKAEQVAKEREAFKLVDTICDRLEYGHNLTNACKNWNSEKNTIIDDNQWYSYKEFKFVDRCHMTEFHRKLRKYPELYEKYREAVLLSIEIGFEKNDNKQDFVFDVLMNAAIDPKYANALVKHTQNMRANLEQKARRYNLEKYDIEYNRQVATEKWRKENQGVAKQSIVFNVSEAQAKLIGAQVDQDS